MTAAATISGPAQGNTERPVMDLMLAAFCDPEGRRAAGAAAPDADMAS